MKLLHISLEAFTATFRLPLFYSGTGLSSPVPPYSTLLGLIGAVAGREIAPNETKLGYVFRSNGMAIDIERTRRLQRVGSVLKRHKETGVASRQFHVSPHLDLFLSNTAFKDAFENPVTFPCLGRSQDIAWITSLQIVQAAELEQGTVRGTLVPFPQSEAAGLILPLPEYYDNSACGMVRKTAKMGKFQAIRYDSPVEIKRRRLVQPDGFECAIYLHDPWGNNAIE